MHLGDPEPVGNLGLRQAFEKPQMEDQAFTLAELPKERGKRGPALGVLQRGIFPAQPCPQRLALFGARRRVQGR